MEDYSQLLKAELLSKLEQRDQELLSERNEKQQLQETLNEKLAENAQLLTENKALKAVVLPTSENVIRSINLLDEIQQRKLNVALRTTPEGVKAYSTFLFGNK